MKKAVIILLILAGAVSCTSTTMVSSWKAPGAVYSKEEFKKVMIIALVKDETTRRIAEDKMTTYNSSFIQSYMIPGHDKLDTSRASVNAFLAKEHIDGIVTMHLVNVDKQLNYVPGGYNGGYYGWYGYNYGGFNSGYYQESTQYTLETNVYSVKQDKLVWSGITATLDPVSIQKTIGEVEQEVIKRMRKDGFLVTDKK
ncbi:MAG: hypothetical protein H7259_00650 [Cytophagales bacterium]|nr:hypothetical protein [Cytophaga sp.]